MADERDWLEEAQSFAVNHTGKELTSREMADEFAKWGLGARAIHLDKIDAQLRDANLSLNEAARIHNYRRALKATHEKLRSIDR